MLGFTVGNSENIQNNQPYEQTYNQPYEQTCNQPVILSNQITQQLQAKLITANIEVRKKMELSNINASENATKAKDRADIASLRELQSQEIAVNTDGSITLERVLFGGQKKGTLPIKLKDPTPKLFKALDTDSIEILYFQVVSINGREYEIYLGMDQEKGYQINQAFDRAGISLNFKRKKETEIRRILVHKFKESAKEIKLPQKHGWYKKSGEWCYAYPDEHTWKEAMKCAFRR